MDKVKLPREVAEEIEKCRNVYSEIEVVEIAIGTFDNSVYRNMQVFAREDFETFLKALVNGYEIEISPEEKVRKYYKEAIYKIGFKSGSSPIMETYSEGQMHAVHFVLDALGIEIPGIPSGCSGDDAEVTQHE